MRTFKSAFAYKSAQKSTCRFRSYMALCQELRDMEALHHQLFAQCFGNWQMIIEVSYVIWHLHISVKYFISIFFCCSRQKVQLQNQEMYWIRIELVPIIFQYVPILPNITGGAHLDWRFGGLCAWLLYFLMENPIGSHFTCTNNMGRKIPQVFIFF